MIDRDRCPVCWRTVNVSSAERWVWAHRDTVGKRCPMSGKILPLSVWVNAA